MLQILSGHAFEEPPIKTLFANAPRKPEPPTATDTLYLQGILTGH